MNSLLALARIFPVLLSALLLSACASPIVTRVTSFNQWPQDAAGSSFSFITPPPDPFGQALALEQASYENLVQLELERRGFKRAAAGQPARLLAELSALSQTLQRSYLQPVFQDRLVFIPPYRNAAGQFVPGSWATSPLGASYIGDRVVAYELQSSQLKLRLLDTQGSPGGQPRAVFESRATYEGEAELAAVAPYLVRAMFEGFPGQNGQVRKLRFDRKSGVLLDK